MKTLALSMIVKDASLDLAECLESVAGIVDEVVIADTGSRDRTVEIAKAHGARLISIEWEDDFAAARNRSLAEVSTDWVLCLDADERLDDTARNELPLLVNQERFDAYQVTIRNYVADGGMKIWDREAVANEGTYSPARGYPAYIEHENVRLFRHDPSIYFVGRVHESVGWRVRETGKRLGHAQFRIHHLGMARESREAKARKLDFYRRLALMKVADQPENAQAHLELGLVELENGGTVAEALQHFLRACELDSSLGVAWYFAGQCQFHLGDPARALECMQRAENTGHATAQVAEAAGDASYNLGDHQAARKFYQNAKARRRWSASIESKLGLAEARCGETDKGLRRLHRAIEIEPRNPSLHDRLIVVEAWLGDARRAAEAAENKLEMAPKRAEDFLRTAAIWSQAKDWERAGEVLRRGVKEFPDSGALRQLLSQIETRDSESGVNPQGK